MMQRVAERDGLAVCVQSPLILTERLFPFAIFSRRQPVSILFSHHQACLRERIDERRIHIRSSEQDDHFLAELLMKSFCDCLWNISLRNLLKNPFVFAPYIQSEIGRASCREGV